MTPAEIMHQRARDYNALRVLDEDRDREARILLEHVTSGDPCDAEEEMTETASHAPSFNTIAYAQRLWDLEGGFTSIGIFRAFARDQQRLEIANAPAYVPWLKMLGLDWAVTQVWDREQAKKREALIETQERTYMAGRMF